MNRTALYFIRVLKILIYIICISNINLLSQGIDKGEFMIVNRTSSYSIIVKMFPIGAIFNRTSSIGEKQYSPRIAGVQLPPPYQGNLYITGIQDTLETSAPDYLVRAQLDGEGNTSGCKFAVGLGLYKIEFWKESQTGIFDVLVDTCLMDWRDANIGNYPSPMGTPDIIFDFYGDYSKFHYLSGGTDIRTDSSIVNKHIMFWKLYGTSYINEPWYPLTPSQGLFKPDNSNPEFLKYPIDCRNFGAPDHQGIENIEMNLKIDNSSATSIIMKSNQFIVFRNGASFIARNVTFNTSSPGTIWSGIKLENSGYDTIVNCTFSNAKTALSITDNILSNHPEKIIRKNTFNISQDNGRGIDVRNQNRILIDSNIFNFSNSNSTVGIFFRNSEPPNAGASQSFYYNLNIVNNKFYYGYLPVYISGLTSSRTPFYVYNNSFTGNNIYSITGLKITGDIKNNRFDVNNNSRSIGLWNSNPNVYGNSFNSISTNMYLNYSFPALSPYPNSLDQLVWTGGRNSFNSVQKENIYLAGSYPYLNKGSNNFTINDTYHIFGSMPDSVNNYYMKYNCWIGYNEIPNYFLYKYINDTIIQNISADYTPTFCDEGLSIVNEIYTDKESGIFDTTIITDDFDSEPVSGDESLLAQARTSNGIKDFPDAIINYKGLINNFSGSELIYTSLYEMYDNYSALDTSEDQTVTDVLFGDLKQYLQSKITAEIYGDDFNSIAYDIILMCETRMRNLEIELTGYEFISLYHPNAEQRMLASWDYEEIEEMINGSGGGAKQLGIRNEELGIEELELNELNRLDKLIDDDPLMKIMKKNYEKNIPIGKKIKSDKLTENKLIQRAKENIFKAKYLQKDEKELRYVEDLKLLMTKGNTDSKVIDNKDYIPQEFILNQNYPNPFNPATNISYSIPVSSFVTLKVYDITGKEIVTLVNEFKQNGSYQVTFNGINLPSGVYYFRLKSGEWNQVRKMLLIK